MSVDNGNKNLKEWNDFKVIGIGHSTDLKSLKNWFMCYFWYINKHCQLEDKRYACVLMYHINENGLFNGSISSDFLFIYLFNINNRNVITTNLINY